MTTGKSPALATRIRRSARQRCGSIRLDRDQAEMFGYTVRTDERPGDPFDGSRSQTRRRIPHPRRDRASGHAVERNVAGRGRRIDPRSAQIGRGTADSADAVARARADSPIEPHPGNAGRLRRPHQGPRAVDRIRPPPAGGSSAPSTATITPSCRSSRSTRRSRIAFAAGIEHSERGLFVRMSPQAVEKTCQLISKGIESWSPAVLANRAGQSADSRWLEADDRHAFTAVDCDELQRNHPRYADRIGGHGGRRSSRAVTIAALRKPVNRANRRTAR